MNSRERIDAAFRQQPTDKVPVCHIGFSSECASALLRRDAFVGGGSQQWREATALWRGKDAHQEFLERSFQDAVDIALMVDNDVVRPTYWRYPVKPTRRVDEHTFAYEIGDEQEWKVLRYDPSTEQATIAYMHPRYSVSDVASIVEEEERALPEYAPTEERFSFALRAQRLLGGERVVRVGAGAVGIPYQQLWLEATVLRPDLIARHLAVQIERAARDIAFLAEHGFRYLFGGIDFAGNDGPMYSPRTFADLFLPALVKVAVLCHQHGAQYLFASDGNTWPVADALFGRSGIDGYYEIDRRAGMSLDLLRDRFPDLGLIGNISSHTVHLGSRQDVVDETQDCMRTARERRGVVVGMSNYVVPGSPVENVRAMIETIRRDR